MSLPELVAAQMTTGAAVSFTVTAVETNDSVTVGLSGAQADTAVSFLANDGPGSGQLFVEIDFEAVDQEPEIPITSAATITEVDVDVDAEVVTAFWTRAELGSSFVAESGDTLRITKLTVQY